MFTYACLIDTHSPSSQYLTYKENNLCVENKDTITHNHSYTLSFWLDNRTHTHSTCSDAHVETLWVHLTHRIILHSTIHLFSLLPNFTASNM